MKRTQQHTKESLKITCCYKKDGADVKALLKQSFRSFVKSGLIKAGT